MKKRLLSLLLTGVLAVGMLAGCGSSSSDGSTSDAGNAGGKETMSVEGDNVTTLNVWTFIQLHQKFYTTMANKWNEEHPDQKVKLVLSNMQEADEVSKLKLALQTGKGAPDIVDINVGDFPGFTSGKTIKLMDLTDYVKEYQDNVVQSRLDLYSKDGKVYGLPTHVGTTVAFYNTELLDEAGIDYTQIKTWDQFKEAGAKYHEATGKNWACYETTAKWMVDLMLAQKGGDYEKEDGTLDVNNSTIKDVLTYIKGMKDAGALAAVPGGQPDNDEAYSHYNDGEFAVQIMPFWQTSRFTSYMKDLKGKVAIAAVPRFSDSDATWTIGGGGTGTSIIASSENADLAAKVMAYIKLSPEANEQVFNVLGFDPVNESVWTDTSLTENPDNDYVQFFNTKPFDALLEMKDSIGTMKSETDYKRPQIDTVFNTEVLTNIFDSDADIQETLDAAQQELENDYQE